VDHDTFNAAALWDAMDKRRRSRDLSWPQVMAEINSRSIGVAARLGDRNHPMSLSAVMAMPTRRTVGCQHALGMLQWLGEAPERFMPWTDADAPPLPDVGPDRRLRWDIPALYAALDAERRRRAMTWRDVAQDLGCAPGQLTGLRKVRYGVGMTLAMRSARWLGRHAASLTFGANW
jgi:hypothetical protein